MISKVDFKNLISRDKKIIIYVPEDWGEGFFGVIFPKNIYPHVRCFKEFPALTNAIGKSNFDIVIMCIWKVEGEKAIYDGNFVEEIRKLLPTAKIIALSALSDTQIIKDSLLSGADCFLRLPFSLDGLFNAIKD